MKKLFHRKGQYTEEEIEDFMEDFEEDEAENDSEDIDVSDEEEDSQESDDSEDDNKDNDSEVDENDSGKNESNLEEDENNSEEDENDSEEDENDSEEDEDKNNSVKDENDFERDDESDDEYERRAYRRKRRIRNQAIVYSIVLVILAMFIAGGVIVGRNVASALKEKKFAKEQAEMQAQLQAEQEAETSHDVVIDAPAPIEIESDPEPEADVLGELAESYISEMSLEDKVAGLFIVTPEALTGVRTVTQAGEGTQAALNEYAVGGLIYFQHNIIDEEQLRAMLNGTMSMSKYPVFLAVDEEGGSVSRVAGSGIDVTQVGDMAKIGESGDVEQAYKAGMTIGTYLKELGFNLDFAPVADVSGSENSVMGDRVFGSDADLVADMVSSVVEGIEAAGVSSCLKHFPGIGSTVEDTHDSRVEAERTLDEMRSIDFIPFQGGIDAGADFVMVSHVIVNDTEDAVPSTLSKTIMTDVLRDELGFEGVIITDALNMAAITEYYTAEEAAVGAITAGADMLLMPDDFHAAYDALLAAVHDGTITEERINESLKRIYKIKYADVLN